MTDFNIPPPPNPTKMAQWAGQLRLLIGILAGAGLIGGAWAGVSAEQIANWLTAIMTVGSMAGMAWASYKSWQDKKAQRAALVASAMVSAAAGAPVAVTVTPEGLPNIATQISVREQLAAPIVTAGVTPQPAPAAP